MDRQTFRAALAGLLYDVDVFARRATQEPGSMTSLIQQIVPAAWQSDLDLASDPILAQIVSLADQLTAGGQVGERVERPVQLHSIFGAIKADGQRLAQDAPCYLPLRPLALARDVFFPGRAWDEEQRHKAYRDLWTHLATQAQVLQQVHERDGCPDVYLETLLLLMARDAWCVPCAYAETLPDVSLYDHSRIRAALAVCLSRHEPAALDEMAAGTAPETPAALLVGGDLSGVQDFIYTITDRGATSSLRGRSFYLQLLTEAAARYVLRQLELPMTNLIYQGGGAFYLLARAGDGERLVQIQREMSQILLAHHRGDLYLALANAPLAAADFFNGRISNRWADLARALRAAKQRRFAELDGLQLARLFAPQDHGGNQDRHCQVCGREHPETRVFKRRPDDPGEAGTRLCPPCISYQKLGDDLRHAAYLWLAQADIPPPLADPLAPMPGGWPDALTALGVHADVTDQVHQVPHHVGQRRVVLALHDDKLDGLRPDAQTAIGRRFLVNVTPIIRQAEIDEFRDKVDDLPEAGSVKPFSVLEAQSTGIQRLGVLRMDVDNLGDMFASGLVPQATLSRIAALSFAISLYFEGWVGHVAEDINDDRDAKHKDTLYSIYSGGDDLFFVGAWNRVMELARRIRADLTPFAAGHPGIHASAGLVLVGGKYPLAQAARDAGEAEGRAKQRDGKDELHFLGQTIAWKRLGLEDCATPDLETVHGMAHHLLGLVQTEKGLKALLHLLIRLQEQHDRADRKRREQGQEINRAGQEQVLYGPWMWRGTYYLKRMAERYKESNAAHTALEELRERLHEDSFRAIEWIGLAARWAELLGRKSQTHFEEVCQ